MASPIKKSVGKKSKGCKNDQFDVITVQLLLGQYLTFHNITGKIKIPVADGKVGNQTLKAIEWFQRNACGLPFADQVVSPNGPTIKFLNLKLPPVSPAKAGTPKVNGANKLDHADVEALIEGWAAKVKLTSDDTSYLRKFLTGSDDILDINDRMSMISLVENGISIMEALQGSTKGISQMSGFSAVVGFIGPFIQFCGFVKDIDRIYGQRAAFYGAISTAYWITSWVYRDERPAKSKQYLDKVSAHSSNTQFLNAWNKGMSTGSKCVEQLVTKVRDKTALSNTDARAAVRFVMRRKNRQNLARDILKSMKTSFLAKPPKLMTFVQEDLKQRFGWNLPKPPSSISPGVAMFFENTVLGVRYPK